MDKTTLTNRDRQTLNAWRMMYNLMDNIKTLMDRTMEDNKDRITTNDIKNVVDYVNQSMENVLKCNNVKLYDK